VNQSERRGIKVLRLAPERGEKRGGIRRYRTFGSNKFDPSGIFKFLLTPLPSIIFKKF